jgi:hypothetical protein
MITTTSSVALVEGKTYIVRKTLIFGIPVKAKKMEVPNKGDLIRLTWLPNPKNNPSVRSAYIGSIGVVEDLAPDGSLCLRMENSMLVAGNEYKFERLSS